MTILKHFEGFLINKGCLQKFIYNLEYQQGYNMSLYAFVEKVKKASDDSNYVGLMSRAFDWTLTPEGNDYWFNIACWWSTYCYNNIIKINSEPVSPPAKGGYKSIW